MINESVHTCEQQSEMRGSEKEKEEENHIWGRIGLAFTTVINEWQAIEETGEQQRRTRPASLLPQIAVCGIS